MFTDRENFFKTCTNNQVRACAYYIKEDQEEGNLERAIEKFGRTLVNEALFTSNLIITPRSFYLNSLTTYNFKSNNIDCEGCDTSYGCYKSKDCYNCFRCFYCTSCKDLTYSNECHDCVNCDECHDCWSCQECKVCVSCTNCLWCSNCEDCIGCEDHVYLSSITRLEYP